MKKEMEKSYIWLLVQLGQEAEDLLLENVRLSKENAQLRRARDEWLKTAMENELELARVRERNENAPKAELALNMPERKAEPK